MPFRLNPTTGKFDVVVKDHTKLSNIGSLTHSAIDTAINTTLPGLVTTHAALTGTSVHGLGTASIKNTGISGNTVPLLDGANTWSANQTINIASGAMKVKVVAADGIGDSYINLEVNDNEYSIGIDKSDSNKFKISNNDVLGTSDLFILTTGGDLTAKGSANTIGSGSGYNAFHYLAGAAGQWFDMTWSRENTGAGRRWFFTMDNTAEAGSNVGSNFQLKSRDDAGNALISSVFLAERSTGNIRIAGDTTLPGAKLDVSISSATLPGLIVNQASTGNIAQFKDNGTAVFTIADGGWVGFGSGGTNVNILATFDKTHTITSGPARNNFSILRANPGNGATSDFYATESSVTLGGDLGTSNTSGVVAGAYFSVNHLGRATQAAMSAFLAQVRVGYATSGHANNILTAGYGFQIKAPWVHNAGGSTMTNCYGGYIDNQGKAGITNAYGLYIAAQSGAATVNLGLWNAGTSRFGGVITLDDAVNVATNATTGTKIGNSATAKLSLYDATPIVRQNHIADADGTLADATTKINAILVALENIGIVKTA